MLDRVLACPNLPTFPTIAAELLELTRDPEVSINDIAKLIMSDQGLASRLLKTVNSSFYGLAQPCQSIERALGFLGLKAVKSLVLGFSVVRVTQGVKDQANFDMDAYWRHTICAASGARQIALATRSCDPDEAFAAGLFQDLGMLACFTALRQPYADVLSSAPTGHGQLPAHEQATLGFTHPEAGAALAEKWRLSEPIVMCIRYHHQPEEADPDYRNLVKTVALGRLAAEVITAEEPAQPLADLMVSASSWFKHDNAQVETILDQITLAADELAAILDQRLGDLPDTAQILAMANEQLVQQQLQAQQEAVELQRRADTLQAQTLTDTLTGAANRKRFDHEMQAQFDRAKESNKPLAVLFIDADRFKSVNDTHGHQAGDAVLIELSGRMKQVTGNFGTVCRYGGEEFAIILPNCSNQKAHRFGELLRKIIASKPFDLTGVPDTPNTLPVTASIGVSAMSPEDQSRYSSPEQLVQEADKAVYEAKEAGRNCVKLYQEKAHRPSEASPTSQLPNQEHASIRVLLVDSDPLAIKLLQMQVTQHANAQLFVASTKAETDRHLEHAQKVPAYQPDLLICEQELADGRGDEIIKAIKSSASPCRAFTILLHKATSANTRELLNAGADRVESKSTIADDPAQWVKQTIQSSIDQLAAA